MQVKMTMFPRETFIDIAETWWICHWIPIVFWTSKSRLAWDSRSARFSRCLEDPEPLYFILTQDVGSMETLWWAPYHYPLNPFLPSFAQPLFQPHPSSMKSCFIKKRQGPKVKTFPATWTLLNPGRKSRNTQITSVKGLYTLIIFHVWIS